MDNFVICNKAICCGDDDCYHIRPHIQEQGCLTECYKYPTAECFVVKKESNMNIEMIEKYNEMIRSGDPFKEVIGLIKGSQWNNDSKEGLIKSTTDKDGFLCIGWSFDEETDTLTICQWYEYNHVVKDKWVSPNNKVYRYIINENGMLTYELDNVPSDLIGYGLEQMLKTISLHIAMHCW